MLNFQGVLSFTICRKKGLPKKGKKSVLFFRITSLPKTLVKHMSDGLNLLHPRKDVAEMVIVFCVSLIVPEGLVLWTWNEQVIEKKQWQKQKQQNKQQQKKKQQQQQQWKRNSFLPARKSFWSSLCGDVSVRAQKLRKWSSFSHRFGYRSELPFIFELLRCAHFLHDIFYFWHTASGCSWRLHFVPILTCWMNVFKFKIRQTCISKVIVFCVTPIVPESFMIISSINVLVQLFLMVGGFGGRSYAYPIMIHGAGIHIQFFTYIYHKKIQPSM